MLETVSLNLISLHLVGALYKEGDIKRDSGFTIFYMGINLGAAAAPFICGYIGEMWGWHYGFSLSWIRNVAGVIVFLGWS